MMAGEGIRAAGRVWSKKGLRDRGRLGGSSKGDAGEVWAGSKLEGEAARLRKGLLEER